jgi:hypothetical protein
MHAEVTNTMNPTVSLSPCRVCDLRVKTIADKRTSKYVSNFVGVDEKGHPVRSSLILTTQKGLDFDVCDILAVAAET